MCLNTKTTATCVTWYEDYFLNPTAPPPPPPPPELGEGPSYPTPPVTLVDLQGMLP